MTLRSLALLASISMSALSAQAGTIIFHTGDPAHPPVGVDFWSTASSGSIVNFFPAQADLASLIDGSVYVEEISGLFNHSHQGATTSTSPPLPEQGVSTATASTSGNVYWYFEYVPSNPLDVPNSSQPYYADVEARGQAYMTQTARSERFGGSVEVQGGIAGLLTALLGTTACGSGGHDSNEFGGDTWSYDVAACGFNFQWNSTLGKWLGKPQWLLAASTLINSLIAVGDDSEGFEGVTFLRQMKVIQVRTPDGPTFVFNTTWQ